MRHLTYGVRMEEDFTDLGLDKAEALIEYEYAVWDSGVNDGSRRSASACCQR